MVFEVVGVVAPKPGNEERVREGLKDLAKHVQDNEPGCLKYQVYEQTNGTKEYVVVEEYVDKAAFDTHLGSDTFKALGKAIQEEDLLAKPIDIKTVEKFTGFSGR